MSEQPRSLVRLISHSAAELFLVVALVFATGWIGVRLAEVLHRLPVGANRDGTIELPIVKSDRHGDVSFEEGFGYKGWWHCTGNNWDVDWRLIAESRSYHVLTRAAKSEPNTKCRIAVEIGGQTLEASVPGTGDPTGGKAVGLGIIRLDSKPYTLTVRPAAADGQAEVNLKSVTLRPE
jgi:hypothetical protein